MEKFYIRRKIEQVSFLLYCCVQAILFCVIVFFMPMKNPKNGAYVKLPVLFFWAICIVILVVRTKKTDKHFWYRLEVDKDVIQLTLFKQVLQRYPMKSAFIKYCAYVAEDEKAFPCVYISDADHNSDTVYFENMTLEGDGNFFLVPLTEKRLITIIAWYKRKIDLPPYEEIAFNDKYQKGTIINFYRLIESMNTTYSG